MVPDMSNETMAQKCNMRQVRQCQSNHLRPRLARIGVNRLDAVFKYLSRHRIDYMTGYSKCCGRRIVAQNWLHCPFCGGDLLGGYPVTLRSRIEDAEQTTMTDHLDQLSRHEGCIAKATKGKVKGLKCVRPVDHTGRHRWPSRPVALLDF